MTLQKYLLIFAVGTLFVVQQVLAWRRRRSAAHGATSNDVDLSWIIESAASVAQTRGRALFKVRSVALRLPTLLGFLGIFVAKYVVMNRWIGLGLIVFSAIPVIGFAPGLQAATLATARGQDVDSEWLWRYMHHAPAYALVAATRWLAVVATSLLFPPLGFWLDLRLSLVGFVLIDGGDDLVGAVRKAFFLTEGTSLRRVWLGVLESFDAMSRYGFFRAAIDERVRRAIAEALLYDYLVKRQDAHVVADSASPEPLGSNPAAVAPAPVASPPVPVPEPSWVAERRVADLSRPSCPRCGGTLVRAELPELVLGRCPRCAGVWLDNASSSKLAEGRLAPSAVVASRQAPVVAERPDESVGIPCPVCGGPMQRTLVPAARLHVDACAAHGTWFDRGELERAYEAFEQSRRDRSEIGQLVADSDHGVGTIYRRGPGAIVREGATALADAARRGARTGIDAVIEGREEDREEMIWKAIGTALELLQGDKDRD